MDRNEALRLIEQESGPLDSPGVKQLLETFGSPEAVIEYWQSMGYKPPEPTLPEQMSKAQSGIQDFSQKFDFDKYLESMKWGPGKMPRGTRKSGRPAFEGMAEMIQKVQGIGQ